MQNEWILLEGKCMQIHTYSLQASNMQMLFIKQNQKVRVQNVYALRHIYTIQTWGQVHFKSTSTYFGSFEKYLSKV